MNQIVATQGRKRVALYLLIIIIIINLNLLMVVQPIIFDFE